jgi:hypothetical protein
MKAQLIFGMVVLTATLGAQAPKPGSVPPAPFVTIEQPDAQRTKQELSQLLDRYPPTLRNVFSIDPSLLSNQAFLAPYPAIVNFLNSHPEVARSPSFYIESRNYNNYDRYQGRESAAERIWTRVIENLSMFAGFGLAIGAVTWLIRTTIDYRRWNRLTKVQTDVHTKLLDRFTGNEDLLAYIQSPAGAKFLESSPITLDPGPRSVGAPLGRILWSVQAGLVSMAAGVGLQVVAGRFTDDAAQPFHAFGVLGVALGLGFVVSAIISFVISQRLGLIEPPVRSARPEGAPPVTRG